MNIKRAKEEIKNTIEAYLDKDAYGAYAIPPIRQRPVLLIGPPGIGKTQIMEQIAKECRIGLVAYTITHHTRQSAVGLPFIEKKTYQGKEYAITQYTMSEIVAAIYEKIQATGLKEGILFIDEINCVSETLAPTMLQFLQCKTFGNHRIPEGWVIAAAGNPPEYNKSVREFDVVTLDRIKRILVEPDFDAWLEYACREQIHPAILSYLKIKPQYFCHIETTVDGKLFATPRGWEDLSRFMEAYERLGKKTDREVVFQYLQHPKIAKDFANYLTLYEKYQNDYQVEEILSGIIKESLCDQAAKASFDEKLSLVGLLLSKLGSTFRELSEKEEVTARLMEGLRSIKDGKLSDLIARTQSQWELLKRQELLTRKEDLLYRRLFAALERYQNLLLQWESGCRQSGSSPDAKAGWEFLREQFAKDSDAFEACFSQAGQMLEHGFDFMEAAFGDSQEMVIFVTELNTNFYCAKFLQEYDCERYYQYNKRLLFDDTEQEIARIMDKNAVCGKP